MESGYQKDTNNVLHRTENDEYGGISGGTDGDTGGNVIVYGGAHATKAGDIEFRSGTTVTLQWDESANTWVFASSGNNTNIVNADDTQIFTFSGGDTNAKGGNVQLYGSTHASAASDILLRQGTTAVLHYDHSITTWDFQGLTVVNMGSIEVDGAATIGGATIFNGTVECNSTAQFDGASTFNAAIGLDAAVTASDEVEVDAAIGITFGSSGPTITSGTGVPATTEPNGSLFLRTDGTTSTTIYSRENGVWTAL